MYSERHLDVGRGVTISLMAVDGRTDGHNAIMSETKTVRDGTGPAVSRPHSHRLRRRPRQPYRFSSCARLRDRGLHAMGPESRRPTIDSR